MAAGNFNGHNHGGLHTGTGKYQKGGVYSRNGVRPRRIPHREFKVGKSVAYVGTHKDFIHKKGTVLSKIGDAMRSNRSTIKVQFSDKISYIYKDNLTFC